MEPPENKRETPQERMERLKAQRPVADATVHVAQHLPPSVDETPAPAAPSPAGGLQVAIQLPDMAMKKDKTRPVNLTWHDSFIKRFDRYCKRHGVSRSSMAEMLLSALLDQVEQQNPK